MNPERGRVKISMMEVCDVIIYDFICQSWMIVLVLYFTNILLCYCFYRFKSQTQSVKEAIC